jgi:hypothetical protein
MRLPSFLAVATVAFVVASLDADEEARAQPAPPAAGPSAADRDTARKLMDDGDDAFGKKDYPGALKAYAAAHAIMNVPSTGVAVAKAQAALGQLLEARDTALEVTRMPLAPKEPAAFAESRKEAADLAAQLDPRIPSIEVQPSGVPEGTAIEVRIDGAAIPAAAATLPRRVNPGTHQISVKAAGYVEVSTEVKVVEGEKRELQVALEPGGPPPGKAEPKRDEPKKEPPVAKKSGLSVLVPIGLATTGAGLALGIGTGVAALNSGDCKKHHGCALGWAADAGFLVALAGAGVTTAGIVITVTAPKSGPAAPAQTWLRLRPMVGPAYLGVQGEY